MKTATELFGFTPFCLGCFSEIPSGHFNQRHSETCPKCGNDFCGSKWYSNPVPRHVVELIQCAMSCDLDKDVDLRDFEVHECSRCEYSQKLGFCQKCDTQSTY
jgi:hypothetical protein